MNTKIIIPLSKIGKYAGQYETVVNVEDSDLAETSWMVRIGTNTSYAGRSVWVSQLQMSRTELIHRVILSRMLGRELLRSEDVDHIDGNGLNNLRSNIRLATRQQNTMNARVSSNNTTGYKCVIRRKNGKYRAVITMNGKRTHLGDFDTAIEAHAAYCAAAKELHGEFYNPG